MHSESTQEKLAKHKKTSSGKVSRRRLVTMAKMNNLEAQRTVLLSEKKIATNDSYYTSRQYSFVLIWSRLFLSQLLFIRRV